MFVKGDRGYQLVSLGKRTETVVSTFEGSWPVRNVNMLMMRYSHYQAALLVKVVVGAFGVGLAHLAFMEASAMSRAPLWLSAAVPKGTSIYESNVNQKGLGRPFPKQIGMVSGVLEVKNYPVSAEV